ncbi:MAG: hypothetical protein KF884_09710 [Fimbriimonadaceae bacterium]|nr:hypothetical protein [Fimbriimonadaceae bacterium]QYK57823.1 MAG: hypothetical protein KF884_09710 [Fimbriimonadaceae bacterium]
MVIVKATPMSERGIKRGPDFDQLMTSMGAFNAELEKAGVMVTGDGLKPSSHGKRLLIPAEGDISVVDGPFPATSELVAGYWLWSVASMDEAVEWAKKCPHPMPGENATLEIRPVYEAEDFGP